MGKRMQNRLETQSAIFDAAVRLIERHGYENTTVEEICELAGVGRATFFRHFEAKAGLLREFNRRLAEAATARLETLESADAADRLRVIADTIYDAWVAAGPGLLRLGADAAAVSDPTGSRTHPELIQLVLEIVRQGIAAGDLHSELPPAFAAYLVIVHLAGAPAWWFHHPDDDLRSLLDQSLEQALYGLAGALTTAPA